MAIEHEGEVLRGIRAFLGGLGRTVCRSEWTINNSIAKLLASSHRANQLAPSCKFVNGIARTRQQYRTHFRPIARISGLLHISQVRRAYLRFVAHISGLLYIF
jgi:hypothetical protein